MPSKSLLLLVDVAHAARGQQLEPALHLADGVRRALAASLGSVMMGVNKCGMPRTCQFDPLRIHENEPHLRGVVRYSKLMIMALMATDLPTRATGDQHVRIPASIVR